jgi:Spy/CpxP family protein refolding chaperone
MKNNRQLFTLLAVLVFAAAVPAVYGQAQQQQASAAGAAEAAQDGGDPIRQLNLTPEQRQQIRSIRENNKEERGAINERLRESNRALDEALNTDTIDEAVIEQRVRDVAAAQASAMRMRILTEVRIRRVLTLEQRTLLRSLQQQVREARRERLLTVPEERQRRREERMRTQQNQRNSLRQLNRQLNPRRNAPPPPKP